MCSPSYELVRQIDGITVILDSNNYLLTELPNLATLHDELLTISASVIIVDGEVDENLKLDGKARLSRRTKMLLTNIIGNLRSIRPKKLLFAAKELGDSITLFRVGANQQEDGPLEILQRKLSSFSGEYENFISQSYSFSDATTTLSATKDLYLSLETTKALLKSIRVGLSPNIKIVEEKTSDISMMLEPRLLAEEDFEKFSKEHKEQLRIALLEFRSLIIENFKPTSKQTGIIEERLDYVSDALDKLNRLDWKSLLFTTTLTIEVTQLKKM